MIDKKLNLSITRQTDLQILDSNGETQQLTIKFDQNADVINFTTGDSYPDHRFGIHCDDVNAFKTLLEAMMDERLEQDATRKT